MFALKVLKGVNRFCRNDGLSILFRASSLNQEYYRFKSFDNSLRHRDAAISTKEIASSSEEAKLSKKDRAWQYLNNLYIQQKDKNTAVDPNNILNNPEFAQALGELRRSSRSLDINELIEALKLVTFFGVPTSTNIVFTLLDLIRRQINNLSLRHVIFLEYLFSKLENTPVITAIKNALPRLFEMQLRIQMDHKNCAELADVLSYAVRNNVSGICISDVVNALIKHGREFEVNVAQSIVWSLCMLRNPSSLPVEELLNNCFAVLNSKCTNLTFEIMESTLTRLSNKYRSRNYMYYNEDFWNNCASCAIRRDVGFENAIHTLNKFNRIGFINLRLLEYCARKASAQPTILQDAHPSAILNFITGLSNAYYIPKEWHNLKQIVEKNLVSHLHRNDLPWLKAATEFMSLDCINIDLLSKAFNKQFLQHALAADRNTLNFHLLLNLYQGAKILGKYDNIPPSSMYFIARAEEFEQRKNIFPLRSYLENIYGNKVSTKIPTKCGHLVDHVIVFNEEREAVKLGLMEYLQLMENLDNEDVTIVGILTFPQSCYAINVPRLKGVFELKIKTLEALGVKVVAVNLNEWANMPDQEKIPYLQREINYKLKEPALK